MQSLESGSIVLYMTTCLGGAAVCWGGVLPTQLPLVINSSSSESLPLQRAGLRPCDSELYLPRKIDKMTLLLLPSLETCVTAWPEQATLSFPFEFSFDFIRAFPLVGEP